MAGIDILGIEVLLIIFNMLTLHDKLMAMRVERRWYNIIKTSHAWKVINFCTIYTPQNSLILSGQSNHFRKNNKVWQLSKNEHDVFTFITLYAGVALREIRLFAVSFDILEFLRTNCLNLQVLDFSRADSHCLFTADEVMKIDFPPNVKAIGVCLPGGFWWQGVNKQTEWKSMNNETRYAACRQKLHQAERLLSRLAKCSNLQKVRLRSVVLSVRTMQHIVQNTKLREIDLLTCIPYEGNDSESTIENVLFYGDMKVYDVVLTKSIGTMTSITSFTLVLKANITPAVLHNFLHCISQWKNLKKLVLKWVIFSEAAFEIMILGLLNLNTLELEGRSITSNVVALIGKHLTKIKVLHLKHGKYSTESVRTLLNHSCLESLVLMEPKPYRGIIGILKKRAWLLEIYNTLVSLLKLRSVKLIGLHLPTMHKQELLQLPVLESVDIEVSESIRELIKDNIVDSEEEFNRVNCNFFCHGYYYGDTFFN
ncbi:uncharacterized protein [Amphiura filiformis]|uniref:uncharacterized protein n=1 Tax=Amphiura filiformis TaxID=82378 RepID=UPI003B20CD55